MIISEGKREEMTGGRKRLHYEKLHIFNTSSNTIKIFKSRRMRHGMRTQFLSKEPERKRLLAENQAYLEGQH
jgi:hypothetical protein